jgi:ArsR family transcriptional regulator, arsenate/arsenite/antimonite-responsive transcriptional repressor
MNSVFKALSDPTRREILRALRRGERSAGELAELFSLSKSTLSGHFAVLKAADLVQTERQGTSIVYRLNTSVFEDVLAHLLDLFGAEPEARPGAVSAPNPEVQP